MGIIYTPRGRAQEYSPLAANLFSGCVHGCKYCYAPACLRRKPEDFHGKTIVRKDVLDIIEKDLKKIQPSLFDDDLPPVLLCFTTDPYQPNESKEITRQALELFRWYDYPFQVLTKGGMRAALDFDLFSGKDAFASTLTFLDESLSKEWEPFAASPSDRIEAIKLAKQKGIHTWVSFEPVLDADQVFQLYEATKDFVDLYKVGKCSGTYSNVIDWAAFAGEIIRRMEDDGKNYYIKNDLRKHIE
jgi:DNA repair photolyase